MFGDWFGMPYDAHHVIEGVSASDGCWEFHFDQGEKLFVWGATELLVGTPRPTTQPSGDPVLVIPSADRVRWEWFHYGRPQSPDNLHFREYRRTPQGVALTTDYLHPADSGPSIAAPAVELM